MKKIFILSLCLILISCGANYKLNSKIIETSNFKVLKRPLIVIPFNGITKQTSNKLKEKLNENLILNKVAADFYLKEIKTEELKLNSEIDNSLEDELNNIMKSNGNDGVILFKYEDYHYGSFNAFTQKIYVLSNEHKILWGGVGYSTFGRINKFAEQVVLKLKTDKIIN